MQNRNIYLPFLLGIVVLTGILSVFVVPTSASGHERDTGYQLVLTQKTAETGYGADQLFTAVLSFPLADAPIDPQQLHFLINAQSLGSGTYVGQQSGQATFLLEESQTYNAMPIGQYSVSATFFVMQLQTTVQSNTVIHTVGKGDIGGVKCLFSGTAAAPGQTITLFVQFETNSIDPHIGTYGVSFIGPASINYPNLTLDSADKLTMLAPSVKGNYTLQCRFNGSDLYNIDQQQDLPFVVSEGRQPGAVRLSSIPTTIVPGHLATLYIVVPTTPGLPAPTGSIFFFYDGFSTNSVALGQGGSVTVSLTLPGNDPTHPLYVSYSGDDTYTRESNSFSLTNPPITGQVPPAAPVTVKPGKGNAPVTATPAGIASATAIVGTTTPPPLIPTLTPANAIAATGATAKTPPTSTPASKMGSGSLLLVAILFLLGLGGSAAGIWYVRLHAKTQMMPIPASPSPFFADTMESFQSPVDDDITLQ